jgi:phage recombination protein Bet
MTEIRKEYAADVPVVTKPEEDEGKSLLSMIEKREVSPAQFNTMRTSLYPGADPMSVMMVIDYCQARQLDPMKKPCHIVPMKVKDAITGATTWRDVIMPGIYEYRTTAQRTNEYLGQARPHYGDNIEYKHITVPEWCEVKVYRWNPVAKQRGEYTVVTYFSEVVSETYQYLPGKKNGQKSLFPNARWKKAPRQMLTKCAEAAALRMAFPDALGGEMTMEEVADHDSQPNGIRYIAEPNQSETQTDRMIGALDGEATELPTAEEAQSNE